MEDLRVIHSHQIVLRSISATNLADSLGIIKLIELQSVASVRQRKRRFSFFGRSSEVPHEMCHKLSYGMAYDLWSIGLLIY